MTTPRTDQVTLLVFKDDYNSRTFQVPLRWISLFGLFVGFLTFLAIGSTLMAVKYYRENLNNQPERFQKLEAQLAKAQVQVDTLTEQMEKIKSSTGQEISELIEEGAPPPDHSAVSEKSSQSVATQNSFPDVVFSFLPSNLAKAPDFENPPINILNPKIRWKGNSLIVEFDIPYIKNDRGNQRGRIIVLARGPDILRAYPNGVLNLSDGSSLIEPKRGEYFSVSRFRKGYAQFKSIGSRQLIKNVEIILLNSNHELLLTKSIQVPSTSSSLQPTPEPKATSTSTPQKSVIKESVQKVEEAKELEEAAEEKGAEEDPVEKSALSHEEHP